MGRVALSADEDFSVRLNGHRYDGFARVGAEVIRPAGNDPASASKRGIRVAEVVESRDAKAFLSVCGEVVDPSTRVEPDAGPIQQVAIVGEPSRERLVEGSAG